LLTAERLVANDEDAIAIAVTLWNFFGIISVAAARYYYFFPYFFLYHP
jgi:hypothetical protein